VTNEDRRRFKELADSIEQKIINLEAELEIAKARLRQTCPTIIIFKGKGNRRKKEAPSNE